MKKNIEDCPYCHRGGNNLKIKKLEQDGLLHAFCKVCNTMTAQGAKTKAKAIEIWNKINRNLEK